MKLKCKSTGVPFEDNDQTLLSYSWSRAPDQIRMFPDRYTIAQLLPARRLSFAAWLFKEKSKYITKHLMYGPSGN